MSIRTNLIIAISLVTAVMMATAGYMGWSSYRVSKQLKRLLPAVAYIEAVATTRADLTRQMKQVVDCLAADSPHSDKLFTKQTARVRQGFRQWEDAVLSQKRLELPGHAEDLQLLNKLKDSYGQWLDLSVQITELCKRNEKRRALEILTNTPFQIYESTLLNDIDQAMEDGNRKVFFESHTLLMMLGRLPWSEQKALQILERTQATVDSVVALARIDSAISKQLKELMDDLISPVASLRPFGWSGNETQAAIADFRRSARILLELGHPNGTRLISEANSIERHYREFTILCQQAMANRQSGNLKKASVLSENAIEQVMQDHLLPELKQSMELGSREIEALSSSVSWQGMAMVVVGALLVIVTLVASLRVILSTFHTIETGTAAITAGNLAHRIDLPSNTELGRLAASFNSMTESLQRSRSDLQLANLELERRVEERTAQLAAANEELRLFSSSVCHDLRTPLSSISGYSQLLLLENSDDFSPEIQKTLKRITESVGEMSEIIGALMKLARVSEDELEQEQVDLSLMARLIAAEKRELDPIRKVHIEIEDGMAATGDASLIRLVLENLMGNAWKFTARRDDGHIFFGCWADTGETVFFIRDNGAGFDMAQSDSLFRPFGRLHNSDEFAGTGIGLATVQRIVSRHGGRIWAEGAPDAGATFYFTLSPKAGEA